MKEFVISDAQAETAVLVGLITQTQNERKTNEYLDELEFLAHTAGAVTVKRFTQKVNGPNSVTYVGKGKLEEIRAYIEAEEEAEREIGMVIFDDELSAKQLRNIEKELKVKILDRTSLIRHACPDGECQDASGVGPVPLHAAPSATLVDALGASGRRFRLWRREGFRGVARSG